MAVKEKSLYGITAEAYAKKTRERNVFGMPGVVESGRGKRRKRHHI